MSKQLSDLGLVDKIRLEQFWRVFIAPTHVLPTATKERMLALDARIKLAELTLAEKVELMKKLAPSLPHKWQEMIGGERKALRMLRLFMSVSASELPVFKFALEYDSDSKSLADYVFEDMVIPAYRQQLLSYWQQMQACKGIKVLSDVDDTLYSSLVDQRFPRKTLYPGVLAFYAALAREPFQLWHAPVTTLSARPKMLPGRLDEDSQVLALTNHQICISTLHGQFATMVNGTLETLLRTQFELAAEQAPHQSEDQMGQVKYEKFSQFSAVYPEYAFVFIGDSGQADALTASLMLDNAAVVTTFIHNLQQFERDNEALSASFVNAPKHLRVEPGQGSGRGMIVFRNYIQAASLAFQHRGTLSNLINTAGLADVTLTALKALLKLNFRDKAYQRKQQCKQYGEDAQIAYQQLLQAAPTDQVVVQQMAEIRELLDGMRTAAS